jgi:Uma2 family endonuclease
MAVQKKVYTVEEFDELAELPENAERLLEFISGEIFEKMPSNPYVSEIAQLISFFIRLFLRQHNIAGHVTEGQGGYRVGGERLAPDVAYISAARQPELARQGYNPNPPELAVEVFSPNDSEDELQIKLDHSMAAGTTVWVFYAKVKQVAVHVPGQPVKTLGIDDTLDGGDALPGFELPVREIFPK